MILKIFKKMKFIKLYKTNIINSLSTLDNKKIIDAINLLRKMKKKWKIIHCRCWRSAGNASHAVNDFRKLCNIDAYTPIDNVSEITAKTNDEGFDTIFDSYLKLSKFSSKDLLMVFSVGGGNTKETYQLI